MPWQLAGKSVQGLTPRTIEMVNQTYFALPEPKNMESIYQDLSQNVLRSRAAEGFGTLLRHSLVWDFENQEIIPALKLCRLIGFPVQEVDFAGFSDHFLTSLVGDAFAQMSIGPVLAAYWLNDKGPWWAFNHQDL